MVSKFDSTNNSIKFCIKGSLIPNWHCEATQKITWGPLYTALQEAGPEFSLDRPSILTLIQEKMRGCRIIV